MNRFIENPTNKTYDILVIGGGISGAAVAYDAASQGYSVALVEKGDFGMGTSSATSKLIHGGMRYLANKEFGLVRESLKERKTFENIAPNFIYPLPFLVPLYSNARTSKKLMQLGMRIYDVLSYDKTFTWDKSKRLPLHRILSSEKALELEPMLQSENLVGAVRFYDCTNFSPERLTLAFIKSAVMYGADVANYAKVESFVRDGNQVSGMVVYDLLNCVKHTLRGRLIINCGGPWADIILNIARGEDAPQHIRRSEGIHLITRKITKSNAALSTTTPTGRSCNLIPWRGHTLVGTTDREYIGDPDQYCVTRERIEEYIAEVNASFGIPNLLDYSDIVHVYGGLRPLVDDQTDVDVFKTSRKYEVFDHQEDGLPGLISVEGGKYTTSRKLAETVLKVVAKKYGRKSKSVTAKIRLAESEIPSMDAFLQKAKADYPDFPAHTVDYMARLYGTKLPQVMDLARSDKSLSAPINADGEMLAQVIYAIREEMTKTLMDVLVRRTGIGTLGNPGEETLTKIASIASGELKWTSAQTERELETARTKLSVPK